MTTILPCSFPDIMQPTWRPCVGGAGTSNLPICRKHGVHHPQSISDVLGNCTSTSFLLITDQRGGAPRWICPTHFKTLRLTGARMMTRGCGRDLRARRRQAKPAGWFLQDKPLLRDSEDGCHTSRFDHTHCLPHPTSGRSVRTWYLCREFLGTLLWAPGVELLLSIFTSSLGKCGYSCLPGAEGSSAAGPTVPTALGHTARLLQVPAARRQGEPQCEQPGGQATTSRDRTRGGTSGRKRKRPLEEGNGGHLCPLRLLWRRLMVRSTQECTGAAARAAARPAVPHGVARPARCTRPSLPWP